MKLVPQSTCLIQTLALRLRHRVMDRKTEPLAEVSGLTDWRGRWCLRMVLDPTQKFGRTVSKLVLCELLQLLLGFEVPRKKEGIDYDN